jgi:hypothetical protein
VGVGAGRHGSDPEPRRRFRRAVTDPSGGAELAEVAARLQAAGYRLGGAALKRPPQVPKRRPGRAVPAAKALFVHRDEPAAARVHTGEVLAVCARYWRALAPLHRWITDSVQDQPERQPPP